MRKNAFVRVIAIVSLAIAFNCSALNFTASMQLGINFASLGKNQSLDLIGTLGNSYKADTSTQVNYMTMMSLGLDIKLNHLFLINSNISFDHLQGAQLSGDVWQLHSAAHDNLNYIFQLSSNVLLWENQIKLLNYG